MYLLHCLPGTLEDKSTAAFRNLGRQLAPDGVLFGPTRLDRESASWLNASGR